MVCKYQNGRLYYVINCDRTCQPAAAPALSRPAQPPQCLTWRVCSAAHNYRRTLEAKEKNDSARFHRRLLKARTSFFRKETKQLQILIGKILLTLIFMYIYQKLADFALENKLMENLSNREMNNKIYLSLSTCLF